MEPDNNRRYYSAYYLDDELADSDADMSTEAGSSQNFVNLLDQEVLRYPNIEDDHPISIYGRHLLSLQPGEAPADEIVRFGLRYALTRAIRADIRQTILYLDLNVINQCKQLEHQREAQLDFLRAHCLTPAKKFLAFPWKIANKVIGPLHTCLVVVPNFESIFRAPAPGQKAIILYAHLLDLDILGGNKQHRGLQYTQLTALVRNYFSALYHRYMCQSTSVEIIVVVCIAILPQAPVPAEADLYMIKYFEFFFNNSTERERVLSRSVAPPPSKAFRVPSRKGLLEVILSLIGSSIQLELRQQLAEQTASHVDFFLK